VSVHLLEDDGDLFGTGRGAPTTGAGERDGLAIWKDVNESSERPVKVRNAHANMKWWLERHFPSLRFEYHQIADEICACEKIIDFINAGMPVLVSVSHARVEGHIILVVGYENYMPLMSTPNFHLMVHVCTKGVGNHLS
jgi:hypothetical protein